MNKTDEIADKFDRLVGAAEQMIDAARATIRLFDLPEGHILSQALKRFDLAFDVVDYAIEDLNDDSLAGD